MVERKPMTAPIMCNIFISIRLGLKRQSSLPV
jgi:hypothetical protein